MKYLIAALALLAGPALAQEAVTPGTGAVLRVLDKLNAKVSDVTMINGDSALEGGMEIILNECRYPNNNPTGEAYAFLTVREAGVAQPVFSGWMVASSPALNPMNHSRYDVWVLRCTTS
jgi:hypothetical protein